MEENKPEVQLEPNPGVLRMTLEVTRAATGRVEVFEITSEPINEGDNQCQ